MSAAQARAADIRAAAATSTPELTDHVESFIAAREADDDRLRGKGSWANRRYALRQFARAFAKTPADALSWAQIRDWWATLTYHQQKLRHAEFRRLFNHLAGYGICRGLQYNPFTMSHDRARLTLRCRPSRTRDRMTIDEFWEIHRAAGAAGYAGLQTAMVISLLTTLRQGDILRLRFADVTDGALRVTIGKSRAQRGEAAATRLSWDLDQHHALRELINRARESSLAHSRCPYIVHHQPERQRGSALKSHPCQLLRGMLIEQFKKCRGSCTSTFHEIRALSSALYLAEGCDIREIMALMAHTSESTTRGYQAGHELPHVDVPISISDTKRKIT